MSTKENVSHILNKFESINISFKAKILFEENELLEFLTTIKHKDLCRLVEHIENYESFIFSIKNLLIKSEDPYTKFLQEKTWSLNATLTIISILESFLRDINLLKERPYIFEYIKNNFDEIKEKEDIDNLKENYHDAYHGSGKVIAIFLKDNLNKKEIKKIVNNYRFPDQKNIENKLKINKLENVINDLYKIRSGFLHEMNRDELLNIDDFITITDNNLLEFLPYLSIKEITYYVWLAIFRYLGFKGDIKYYPNYFTQTSPQTKQPKPKSPNSNSKHSPSSESK